MRPALAVATVLLLAGLLVLPACSSDAEAATFQREPVDAPTAHPFMPSVGTDDAAVTTPAKVTAGDYSAKIPGLYGGSGDNAVCDPAALATYLSTNADKASAWAKVLGIGTADIPEYITTLTPVILRTDTAVTNHGFENGTATSIPAVLQAGTAVLVDDHGAPVVKCGCGNPLTAPPSTKGASFTGATWNTFAPDTVTTIEPAPEPVAALVIADPSGTGIVRPIGTTGERDTPFDPATMTGVDDPTATTPGGAGTTAGLDEPAADDPSAPAEDPTVTTPGSADADDGSGPAADTPTDTDSNAENPDATTAPDPEPTGGSTEAYTFSGTNQPGPECNVPAAPVDVEVTGSGASRRITLPSAGGAGFDGLVFAVNPDGSIDADTTWSPPGAPGLVVTYRFQGQLTINDPPTPSTVTGTLTVSGGGAPDCVVQYDVSGQTEPTPTSSDPAPSNSETTYVATFGSGATADYLGYVFTPDCVQSGIVDDPFTITIRVREGRDGGEVRVVGTGWDDGTIAARSPLPMRDLRGGITDGRFSVGGSRTYDGTLLEGDFTARWSGEVGARRTRPAEFPLTIRHTWHRDRDAINWLRGSGGPPDYSCSYDVTAVRQG